MTVKTRVPSPEEIKRRLAAPTQGVAVAEESLRAISHEVVDETIESKVVKAMEKLKEDRAGKLLSASEMRAALFSICAKYDIDPMEELVKYTLPQKVRNKLGLTDEVSVEMRVKVLSDLVGYMIPKLKSVEVSGTVDHEHHIEIVRYGEDGTVRREKVTPNTAPVIQGPMIDVEVAK